MKKILGLMMVACCCGAVLVPPSTGMSKWDERLANASKQREELQQKIMERIRQKSSSPEFAVKALGDISMGKVYIIEFKGRFLALHMTESSFNFGGICSSGNFTAGPNCVLNGVETTGNLSLAPNMNETQVTDALKKAFDGCTVTVR